MKKKTRRFLAMLLAAAMVLQQGSALGVLADETEPISEKLTEAVSETQLEETDVPVTETEAFEQTETSAPETKAEEPAEIPEPATETKPEETEPTTQAAQTEQTEKTAGEVPTEPETNAESSEPVTESELMSEAVTEQITEAQSELAAETAAEPETEQKTEGETAAETETEALEEKEPEAGPTLLNAECEGVSVTVEAGEGVLKAGTVLNVEKAAGKRVALEAIQGALDENTKVNKKKFLVYDITLMLDGEEVQPDGEVTVSFGNVPFEAEENEELIVAHLNEEEASPIGTISMFSAASGTSEVEIEKGLSIKTTHFSTYLVAVLEKEFEEDPEQFGTKDQQDTIQGIVDSIPKLEDKYVPQNGYYFTDGEIDAYLDSSAFDFHIFASDVEIESGVHTNGNIAAETFRGGDGGIGNNQNNGQKQDPDQDNAPVEEFNYFGTSASDLGNVAGGSIVVGPNVETSVGSNGSITVGKDSVPQGSTYKVYKEEEGQKFLNIADELTKLEQFSKDLARIGENMTAGKEPKDLGITIDDKNGSSDQRILKVQKSESKVVYYNVKWSDLVKYKWDIELDDGQTLVVNVDMTGATATDLANLNIQSLNGHGNQEDVVYSDCNLLWNFYTKQGDEIQAYTTNADEYAQVSVGGTFMGTILAPKANIQFGAVNGSVIASKAKHTNAESHKWTFTGMIAKITVRKELEDDTFEEGEKKTFWFAVFDNPQGTGNPVYGPRSVTFEAGTGTKSVVFPGIELEKDTTYWVFEVDENGKPVSEGYQGYAVAGSGTEVDLKAGKQGNHYSSGVVTIKNEHKYDDVDAEIKGTKKLTGIDTSNEKFWFDLYEIIEGKPSAEPVKSVSVTGKGHFHFTMNYTKPGVYKYVVKERDLSTSAEEKGFTKDPSEYEVTVNVTEDANGKLIANVTTTGDKAIEFTNKCVTGSIVVTKQVTLNGTVDETVTKDFTVALYDANNNEIAREVVHVTKGTGSVSFDELELGKYTIYELDADGNIVGKGFEYEVSGSGTAVTLTKEDLEGEATIVNNITKGKITLTKTGKNKKALAGAEFDLYRVKVEPETEDVKVNEKTLTTDANGQIFVKDLEPGTYYFVETKAPTGYVTPTGKDAETASVTVTPGQTALAPLAVKMENTEEAKGKITLTKTGKAGTLLKGAKFDLYREKKSGEAADVAVRTELVTDEKGQIVVENLEPGTYYFVEIEAPAGYVTPTGKDAETDRVTVEAGKATLEPLTVDMANTEEAKGEITLTKTGKDKKLLAGAEFDLYRVKAGAETEDVKVNDAALTTDDKGQIVVKDLEPGTYYFVETAAPAGYVTPTGEDAETDRVTVAAGQATLEPLTVDMANTEEAKGEITLTKTGKDKKLLAGAEFDLYREKAGAETEDVKVNAATLTTDDKGQIVVKDLEPGTYYFVETAAPAGYVTPTGEDAETDRVTVEAGKATLEPLTVDMANTEEAKGEITLTKTGKDKKLLAGAEFDLYRVKAGAETEDVKVNAATLTTDDKGQIVVKDLEPGTYYFVETAAPAGYVTPTGEDAETDRVTVEAGQATLEPLTVDMANTEEAKGKLTLTKTDKADGSKLAGAEFDLFRVKTGEETTDSKVNEKTLVTDEAGQIIVENLEPGTYYFVETKAPAGYVTPTGDAAKTKEATVLAGQNTPQEFSVSMENEKTSVKVSKVDVLDSKELEGAHIQLLDKDGNVVEEWNSTKEAHEVKGLKTGETYTLKETVAPNGYSVTVATEFALNADGTLDIGKTTTKSKDGVLLIEDSLNIVNILKVDESGAALAGAKLIVKDAAGKVVDSWTTDGKAHTMTGVAAGKYTLSEVEAPEGYEVSADVAFEITGKETAAVEVTMTDRKAPADNKNSLTVTKQLRIEGLTSDYGLRDAVFYVALFSDVARTQRVSSVKQIVFKDAAASSVTFNNLAAGTYYVGETDENGTPLTSGLFGTAVFTPEYTSEAQFTFEGKADSENAMFTNVFLDVPDGLYISGELTVTKKILINGEEGTSDDTFYARVFSDAALAHPASDVLVLNLAGGSSASATATNLFIGVTLDSSATYYVAETDANGTPLDPDAITEFEISIDKSEVVLSPNASSQEVVITNSFTEEEETETEIETETESETEVSEKKTAPQTGDDTDYMRYLLLMALSAGICAVALGQKRRKARHVEK